jgi:hypothetical protein
MTYFRRKLSSENGFEGLRTLDLPRSTFQEPGDGTGDEDLSSPLLDLARVRRGREPVELRLGEVPCGCITPTLKKTMHPEQGTKEAKWPSPSTNARAVPQNKLLMG